MWPAGQFNAAVIYRELKFYTMADMHMKRYLALKLEETKNYQDRMYIWEEKIKDFNVSSCPGGTVCGGSPVIGQLGQKVCGSDCVNQWACTTSGWQQSGNCP